MIWRTDKPTEKVIVAKLAEVFCHLKDSYAILRLINEPYQHYSEDGEEIPYSAIEKWASLEEEKLPEDLEEASHTSSEEFVYNSATPFPNSEYIAHRIGFEAGAKWDRAKMMEKALEGVVQDDGQFINFGDGRYIDLDPTMGLKPVFELTDGYKVKVIVIKEEK